MSTDVAPVTSIDVTLSAYEPDDWPEADETYLAFVTRRLTERYPTARLNVTVARGDTTVVAYRGIGAARVVDTELSKDLLENCKVRWWYQLCSATWIEGGPSMNYHRR